ncbi:uncharacterized protein [Ptychodera flava]|uniref:uncharacterized protein n=1 Tax=Ptychodera flava TaxID=63121 RepID=UPI003969E78E
MHGALWRGYSEAGTADDSSETLACRAVVACTFQPPRSFVLCAQSHQLQDQFLGSVSKPMFLLDNAGSHPILRALLSDRVPTSTVRVMMTRYLTELDLGYSQTLAAVRMVNHRRDQLAQTLMFLRMLLDEMTEATKDIQSKGRVYTFQVEGWGCNCSLYYRDERGQMRGFFVDVVLEVCKEAGKICKLQEHHTLTA